MVIHSVHYWRARAAKHRAKAAYWRAAAAMAAAEAARAIFRDNPEPTLRPRRKKA